MELQLVVCQFELSDASTSSDRYCLPRLFTHLRWHHDLDDLTSFWPIPHCQTFARDSEIVPRDHALIDPSRSQWSQRLPAAS